MGEPLKLPTIENLDVCYYCELKHRKVECRGIYYCPNVLCMGPGAAHWRSKMRSYREVGGGRHTVDEQEIVTRGLAHAFEIEAKEPDLAAHIRASAKKWQPPAEPTP